jgi:phosphoserine aminotransferase
VSRKLNFFAGPSVLPVEVLQELKENIADYKGNGYALIEASHRGKVYDQVHYEAINLLKELMGISDDYSVFFLGGGATLQFSMIPMNFLKEGKIADYTVTGNWAKKAYEDAAKVGKTAVLFDGKDSGYTSLPEAGTVKPSKDSAYLHITTNETIGGIQWKEFPETGDVPLIADMSSDILSRPVPTDKFAMIYAGAQKNLGPAGTTIAIVRKDLLERCSDNLTAYLNYKVHAGKDGLYNTPPVFSIWGVKLVLEWVKKMGGAEAMAKRADRKSSMLYDTIDGSDGYYTSPVDSRYRSTMNVVYRLPNEELDAKFIKEATDAGMLGLKGYRTVGGCRASIYNSLPEEAVQSLVDFMKEFQRKNG